jgi:hypothetical protein
VLTVSSLLNWDNRFLHIFTSKLKQDEVHELPVVEKLVKPASTQQTSVAANVSSSKKEAKTKDTKTSKKRKQVGT